MAEREEVISMFRLENDYGSTIENDSLFSDEDKENERGGGDDVLAERKDGTSNFSAIMNIIKGNVDAGVLALPNAFSHAGILVGTVGLAIIGIIFIHCMHILVRCSHTLCRKMGRSHLDYADVAEHCFKLGPKPLTPHSAKARNVVTSFLTTAQFSFCCVYILFISQNTRQVVQKCIGDMPDSPDYRPDYPMRIQAYEIILVVIIIPFIFIKNISHLAPFSTFANVASFAGLGIILYYILIHEELQSVSRLPLFRGWSELILFIGAAFFSFESIGVILPIENSLKEPKAFPSWFGVLNVAMTIVLAFYIAIGFYGYIEFGNDAKGSITLNLKSWYGIAVQILFSLCVFSSYLLQFHVPMTYIGPYLASSRLAKLIGPNILDGLFRIGIVVLTFIIAATVDEYLDLLIALVGSVTGCTIGLILPAFFEIITFWPDRHSEKHFKVMFCKDVLIIIFGIFCLVVGTIVALAQLIQKLKVAYGT